MFESSSKQTNPPTSSNLIDTDACVLRNVQEQSMQSLCKQSLKSKLFRGFYIERRDVENLQSYRDIVALEKGEVEFQKLLFEIRKRVYEFYFHMDRPLIWCGITSGKLCDVTAPAGAIDTFIWTELNELDYGQYWFKIETICFSEKEVFLKLKMVGPVENDGREATLRHSMAPSLNTTPTITETHNKSETKEKEEALTTELNNLDPPEPEIVLKDFVQQVQSWSTSIERSVYNFMSKDITKQIIFGCLRFLLWVIILLASGSMYALRYLGNFTLRFICEGSRRIHVLSPIFIKIFDLVSKIIGGFYILLTMVWKDVFYYCGCVRSRLCAMQARSSLSQDHANVNDPMKDFDFYRFRI